MADSSETTLAVIAEVTAGTTPATPAFSALRITGDTLVANYETLVSNELRADATVADVRRTGVSTAGEVNFELHKATILEDIIAAAVRGTWAANVLKGGVVKKAFTFERKIIGSGATAYLRFVGSRLSGMSLSLSPDEIVTGSFRILGTAHTADTAIIAGATYGAATTTAPMAGVDVTSLAVSGVAGVDYMNMTMEVDSGLRVQRKLGAVAARGIGFGRRQITGTLTAYFEDLTAYNAFLNNLSPSITAAITDGTNTYTLVLPKIRLTGGEVPTPGNDQDMILTLNYQAVYDGTATSDFQLTRAP